MRRALALAVTLSLGTAPASAETWTKFFTMENGADVSFDKDYTYKDKASGRLVIMQALSKGSVGPSAPGKADSIGTVVALDCRAKDQIAVASYRPNQPLETRSEWRGDKPTKADGKEGAALIAAICPGADAVPVK